MEVGKPVSAYKVSGQQRVVGILGVESADELDQILLTGLPMAYRLEVAESSPCASTQPSQKTPACGGANELDPEGSEDKTLTIRPRSPCLKVPPNPHSWTQRASEITG